ncbi:MAG TPA: cytochrome c, partial [Ktedonobacteraceae bacterium]|nr:cytochrome c [Ktedonobacteraceae bacterium]
MNARRLCGSILTLCSFALAGCSHLSGRPQAGEEAVRPDQVTDFSKLYAQNCSGCHGADGQHGPAMPLGNPEYQAIANEGSLGDAIGNGVQGTLMPAFSQSAGGTLTDDQINALVDGIRSRWYRADVLKGLDVPPYNTDKQGDAARGQQVFVAHCASCHTTGVQQKNAKLSSVTDGSYLALIGDQSLRAIIIAGRPDLGHPDWRGTQGHPMSDQDVTDVVAWMASQRQQ